VEPGESCPTCAEPLRIVNGIEAGHIFKLGTKYSVSLKANYLDEQGKENPIIMGSYGIGVDRIIACHIEQHHDAKGIIWTGAIAPYDIHLICVNANTASVVEKSEQFYNLLKERGFSVLFDDRANVSPGFKFNDADLMGMPLQVVVGEKNLKNNLVELKDRLSGKRWTTDSDRLFEEVVRVLRSEVV
jgi:prolyl-tRNA synthetase